MIIHILILADMNITYPALTSEVLASRFALNQRIMSTTSDFQWLSNLEFPSTTAFLAMAETKVVSMTDTGELTIYTSSLSRTFLYDSTWYYGTIKSWICPVIEYPVINPVRATRFVSILYFLYCVTI